MQRRSEKSNLGRVQALLFMHVFRVSLGYPKDTARKSETILFAQSDGYAGADRLHQPAHQTSTSFITQYKSSSTPACATAVLTLACCCMNYKILFPKSNFTSSFPGGPVLPFYSIQVVHINFKFCCSVVNLTPTPNRLLWSV